MLLIDFLDMFDKVFELIVVRVLYFGVFLLKKASGTGVFL